MTDNITREYLARYNDVASDLINCRITGELHLESDLKAQVAEAFAVLLTREQPRVKPVIARRERPVSGRAGGEELIEQIRLLRQDVFALTEGVSDISRRLKAVELALGGDGSRSFL
nr:hypothetical protein CFP56_68791 [Quercus suber]